MPKPKPWRSCPSALVGRTWEAPGLSTVRVEPWGPSLAKDVDAVWPAQRRASAPHQHWSWQEIGRDAADRFAVHDDTDLVALWAAQPPTLQLQGQRYYRLDYLEVRPPLVGARAAGVFAMACVASRARELGCIGLVLAAFPEVAAFYRDLGAVDGAPPPWRSPDRDLLPFTLTAAAFDALWEVVDDPEAG